MPEADFFKHISSDMVALAPIGAPQNGQIFTTPKTGHVSLNTSRPEAVCNDRKIVGVAVYSRSNPGYQGSDSDVIGRAFPNGNAQEFRIDVSVR